MDEPIRWNKKKHDETRKSSDQDRGKAKVEQLYLSWKKEIQGCRTSKGLADRTEKFKGRVMAVAKKYGMSPAWLEFTIALIDEKVKILRAGGLHAPNQLTIMTQSGDKTSIMEHDFQTRQEFEAIPLVKRLMDGKNFGGFAISDTVLFAVYKDLTWNSVGHVKSRKGLEHMPTMEQVQVELEKAKNKKESE